MKVTVLPAEDPADVRQRAGLDRRGSWYSPRKRRPAAFRVMQGRPLRSDGRTLDYSGGEND